MHTDAESMAAVITKSFGSAADHILMSVVIPTLDRPELLRRCVESLLVQTMEPQSFEIIVVADGPSKTTKATVFELRDSPAISELRYFELPFRCGPAAARNYGWRSARGAIIAFTDDDCIAQPTWLETGRTGLEDSRISGLWGRIV